MRTRSHRKSNAAMAMTTDAATLAAMATCSSHGGTPAHSIPAHANTGSNMPVHAIVVA